METSGFMGGFARFSEWVMRLTVTNLLWLLCAAPFAFIFVTLLFADHTALGWNEYVISAILLSVLAPFTLFPSTTALFSVARKWIMGDEDAPLLKTFFTNYAKNYVQSMIGGIIFTLLLVLCLFNFQFYFNLDNGLRYLSVVFVLSVVLIVISFFNFFCILSHMHLKTFAIIKNSFLIAIGRPGYSLIMLISNIFIIYIGLFYFKLFLAVFFMGSVMAYVTFYYFYRMYQKITETQ